MFTWSSWRYTVLQCTPFLKRVPIASLSLPSVSLVRLVRCQLLRLRFGVDDDRRIAEHTVLVLAVKQSFGLSHAWFESVSVFAEFQAWHTWRGTTHYIEGYLATWMWAGYWYSTWHAHVQLNRFYVPRFCLLGHIHDVAYQALSYLSACNIERSGRAWGRG